MKSPLHLEVLVRAQVQEDQAHVLRHHLGQPGVEIGSSNALFDPLEVGVHEDPTPRHLQAGQPS